eukprot:PhM_4_TR13278/c0_g1_i1/m.105790
MNASFLYRIASRDSLQPDTPNAQEENGSVVAPQRRNTPPPPPHLDVNRVAAAADAPNEPYVEMAAHSDLHVDISEPPDSVEIDTPTFAPYEQRYPTHVGLNLEEHVGDIQIAVPWHLRSTSSSNLGDRGVATRFRFLSTRYFWSKVEFAFRVAVVSTLPAAALIANETTNTMFVSILATFGAIICVRPTFGEALNFMFEYIKGTLLYLPLCMALVPLEPWRSIPAWVCIYIVVICALFVFGEGFTRRMSILLFNICLVAQYGSEKGRDQMYPLRVCADFSFGCALGVLGPLVPIPRFAGTLSREYTSTCMSLLGTTTVGLSSSLWCKSNIDRHINLVRIRAMRRTIESVLIDLKHTSAAVDTEDRIMCNSQNISLRRNQRVLIERIAGVVDALQRTIRVVSEVPELMTDSKLAWDLGDALARPLTECYVAVDRVVNAIGNSTCIDEIVSRKELFDDLRNRRITLERAYEQARRRIFFEEDVKHVDDSVPLVTFFLFNTNELIDVLLHFEDFCNGTKPPVVPEPKSHPSFLHYVGSEIASGLRNFKNAHTIKEGVKVAVSMTLAVGFFYWMDDAKAIGTGPTIIAFVMGSTSAEALQASVVRLFGTLFGAVLGFFGANIASKSVDRVAILITILFVFSFFRSGKKYGHASFYASFVLAGILVPQNTSKDDTIARIMQNTFAVMIYITISVCIFRAQPMVMLRQARARTIEQIGRSVCVLMQGFSLNPIDSSSPVIARDYVDNLSQMLRNGVRHSIAEQSSLHHTAEQEPQLKREEFPIAASNELNVICTRMTGLLEAGTACMARIWCDSTPPRAHTLALLKALAPIASDVATITHQLSQLLMVSMLEGSGVLGSELVAKSVELLGVIEELKKRKMHNVVTIVRHVHSHVRRESVDATSLVLVDREASTSTNNNNTDETITQTPHHQHRRYRLPMKNIEIESIHSLVLCLMMFWDEIRRLLMVVEELHDATY